MPKTQTFFKQPSDKKNIFNDHIEGLSGELAYYKEILKEKTRYTAPETLVECHDELVSFPNVEKKIRAHKQRIAILKKMQNNEAITSEEHQLLLKVSAIQKDTLVRDYSKVTSSLPTFTI